VHTGFLLSLKFPVLPWFYSTTVFALSYIASIYDVNTCLNWFAPHLLCATQSNLLHDAKGKQYVFFLLPSAPPLLTSEAPDALFKNHKNHKVVYCTLFCCNSKKKIIEKTSSFVLACEVVSLPNCTFLFLSFIFLQKHNSSFFPSLVQTPEIL